MRAHASRRHTETGHAAQNRIAGSHGAERHDHRPKTEEDDKTLEHFDECAAQLGGTIFRFIPRAMEAVEKLRRLVKREIESH